MALLSMESMLKSDYAPILTSGCPKFVKENLLKKKVAVYTQLMMKAYFKLFIWWPGKRLNGKKYCDKIYTIAGIAKW